MTSTPGSAGAYIRDLLAGASPNGADPARFGEWGGIVGELQTAYLASGTDGVRRAFGAASKAWPALLTLVAAPPLPDAWDTERGNYSPNVNLKEGQANPRFAYPITEMWKHLAGMQEAWGSWILANNITLIGGVMNVGKSPLLLAIVAGYLQGEWPDRTPVPSELAGRNVLYCTPEGFGEQTDLLASWGLREDALARIFALGLPNSDPSDVPEYIVKLDGARGMQMLQAASEDLQPGLIVIDGLRAAMAGEESSSTDVDRFFGPLVRLVKRHKAILLISHHLTKGAEGASQSGVLPSPDWFRGSGDILAKARAAWIVDQPDANDPEQRRITLVKASKGPRFQQMAFRMSDPVKGLQFSNDIPRTPAKTKKETARRFILQMLRGGKQTYEQLWEMAEREGLDVSAATFRDARVELSKEGKIVQVTEGAVYYWALPVVGQLAVEPPDDLLF